MTRYSILTAFLLISFVPSIGCREASDQSGSVSTPVINAPKQNAKNNAALDSKPNSIDPNDRPFLSFGEYFEVKKQSTVDFSNPHETIGHAVWTCSQGQTKELLAEMPHVETDVGLGEAFVTFLGVFGPDLEQFRNDSLKLKFHAYALNDETSVWYYYLCNANGDPLPHSPWVTAHRSRSTAQCAVTGIFLYDADIGEPGAIPSGLLTVLDE